MTNYHPDVLTRIKLYFRLNGEWVLLGLFCFLCATGGYSLSSWQDQNTVLENQQRNDERLARKEAEWNAEKQGFRDRLEVRNKQYVAKDIAYQKLVEVLAAKGISTDETAKSSANAAQSAARALEIISTDKAEGNNK